MPRVRPRPFLAAALAIPFAVLPAAAGDPCPGVSCLARPSESPHDVGYYVGGGAPCRGDHRLPDEGTWGWDYGGCLIPSRVALLWSHGRHFHGGVGAYRTVGPTKHNDSSP
jgi:hypothetical protein